MKRTSTLKIRNIIGQMWRTLGEGDVALSKILQEWNPNNWLQYQSAFQDIPKTQGKLYWECPWLKGRQKAKVNSEKRWQILNRVSSWLVFHKFFSDSWAAEQYFGITVMKLSSGDGELAYKSSILGGGLLWRQLQWGIRNPLCPVLGTWSQTITAYLPFPGTDKLHKNQEDFEKPGSEIFW